MPSTPDGKTNRKGKKERLSGNEKQRTTRSFAAVCSGMRQQKIFIGRPETTTRTVFKKKEEFCLILTAAQMTVKALEKNGVSMIFGYPGAANCPIIDRLADSEIKHILVRNEQGAAHMASGYARATGKVGVCTATSGPGATNLITGIATAFMDSVPMVIITGQVASKMIGSDAFQEVDITGATIPFTKHNYLIKDGEDIPRVINEAFYIAGTGRPGPVLIDMPMDILKKSFDYPEKDEPVSIRGYHFVEKTNEAQIKKAAEAFYEAKRPVILAGGGIVSSKAVDRFRKFADALKVPVVSTMTAIGVLPCDDENYFGMIGSHGVKAANLALNNADLVMILGARLGDRSIANAKNLKSHAKLIHIDIDPAEIGKNIIPDIPVVGDIKDALKRITPLMADHTPPKEWIEHMHEIKKENTCEPKHEDCGYVNPRYFVKLLSQKTDDDAFISTEVGQNQIWTANYYNFKEPKNFVTSAGFGTMGYGLPAAIGASAASGKQTVALMGDGSFQMDFCELATMCQWDIPVKMVVFENKRLGMVHEHQYLVYNSNYYAVNLDGSPDFCKLAAAYGIPAEKISENSEADAAIDRLLKGRGSYLLVVSVNPSEPTGDALNENELPGKEA